MANIKHQFRQVISRIITLIPDRFFQLIITLWLEKVSQQEDWTPQDRDSLLLGFYLWLNRIEKEEGLKDSDRDLLNLGFNLLLDNIAREDPKTALRSLLEIDDNLIHSINTVAIKYDNGVHVKHRLTKYHDFFTDRIQKGDRVLDIGCGNGALANDIAQKSGAIVTGIDINSESIQFAKRRFTHPNLAFIEGNALSYNFNESFNVIVLSNVLEHIEYRIEFLLGIQANIQPEQILIRVPAIDRHWLVPLRQELGLFYFSDITHYTEYTCESFEEELNAADLQIKHLQINWGEIWSEVRMKSHQ
ncbi:MULTISPECIES: class I SAM-dependent methyltransferase [Spirulina sp. CCY15215]|uniref:class I SAM-dependent methyltransferase n=1 Tax=Spirulina sp. CCY15215 TaxID=2767591 RepID=UPI00194E6302